MYRLENMRESSLDRLLTIALMGLMALAAVLAWSVVTIARAQDAVPAAGPEVETLFNAVASGEWFLAAALGLSALVYGLRTWGAPFLPDGKFKGFVLSDAGGVVVTLLGALLGGFASAIASDIPFGAKWAAVAFASVKVSLAAMGGYAGVKKLLFGKKAPEPAIQGP